jgi:hypothetical protein
MNNAGLDEEKEAKEFAQTQVAKIKQTMQFRVGEEKKMIDMLIRMKQAGNMKEDEIVKRSVIAMKKYRKAMAEQMSAEELQITLASAKRKKEAELAEAERAHQEEIALVRATYKNVEDAEREVARLRRKHQEQYSKGQSEIKKINAEIAEAERRQALEGIEARRQAEANAAEEKRKDQKRLKEAMQGDGDALSKAKALQDYLKKNPIKHGQNKSEEEKQAEKDNYAQSKENYAKVREDVASKQKDIDKWNRAIQHAEKLDPDDHSAKAEAIRKNAAEAQANKDELLGALKEGSKQANADAAKVMKSAVTDALKGMFKKAQDEALDIVGRYMGSIDARLQGSGKSFKELQNTISNNLSLSPFVKTTAVMEKLKEATDAGISYNIEQRAFLAGIADKIASTFDAFDSNLLRIIRLQQADSTVARMGMEASLTKLFNSMFEDSSYMSGAHDAVSGAIIDANSQLARNQAAEFEYMVHKWLGALSSLGLSDDTVSEIAKGINYLATGDVTNLSNSSSLQTLFAMAASNANMEYSELLLNGMDAQKTNKLMASMVSYLKEIAENSENQVVKSAYGDIMNISLSDMKAISNMTADEISTLYGNSMSYSDMTSEMNTQMLQLLKRTSIANMMDNLLSNVMYASASDLVNNPAIFAMQKMVDFMEETKTDIEIPFINVYGFGLDLNASVKDLMQMGLGLTQAFSMVGSILGGLGAMGGFNLNAWGAKETTSRGNGLNLSASSTLGGVSGSMGSFATNGNSEDAKNSSMSSATDDAEESKKVTNKNTKASVTIEDVYKAIVGESAESFAVAKEHPDSILSKVFDNSFNALRVSEVKFIIEDDGLAVHDAILTSVVSSIYEAMVNPFGNVGEGGGSVTDGADPVLAAVFDHATSQLKIVDDRMSFKDKQLQVVDTQMADKFTADMTKIKELLSSGTSTSTVKLSEDSKLKIDKEELKDVLKEILYSGDKTFGNLITLLNEGNLEVKKVAEPVEVKNVTGDKLQVSNLIW